MPRLCACQYAVTLPTAPSAPFFLTLEDQHDRDGAERHH